MISCAVAAVLGSIHWPWAVRKLVKVRNTIPCPFKKNYFSNCQGIKIVTTLYHLIFTVHVTNSVVDVLQVSVAEINTNTFMLNVETPSQLRFSMITGLIVCFLSLV